MESAAVTVWREEGGGGGGGMHDPMKIYANIHTGGGEENMGSLLLYYLWF